MARFEVPKIVEASYAELYDLIENRQSETGLLNPRDVAAFFGKDYEWFRKCIYAGAVPFAFGTNKMVERGNACIHVLPFFQFVTQGTIFNPVRDREIIGPLTGLDS